MSSYGGVTLQHGQVQGQHWVDYECLGRNASSLPRDLAERQGIVALTVSRLYFTRYLSSSVIFHVMLLVAAISSFCPLIHACDS